MECLFLPVGCYQTSVVQRSSQTSIQPFVTGYTPICFLFFVFFFTPEGFTTVVANEGLEKARAYLNQVPRDRRLYIPLFVAVSVLSLSAAGGW